MNGRISHKHDFEGNWLAATNFIPLDGELIIYDKETANDVPSKLRNNTSLRSNPIEHVRFKIGDGSTNVNLLPFIVPGNIHEGIGVVSIAGGTNDKTLANKIVGYDISSISDAIIEEQFGSRGLFIKEQSNKDSESIGDLTVAYGVGNQSITALSNTLGVANQAGSKGFYLYKAIVNNDDTITIYLNNTQKPYYKYQQMKYLVTGDLVWKEKNTSQSWNDENQSNALSLLAVDDFISITLFSGYILAGKIKTIIKESGILTISNDLGITQTMLDKDTAFPGADGIVDAEAKFLTLAPHDFTVNSPNKPHVGVIDIKFGSLSVGVGNSSSGTLSATFGIANIADGTAAFVTGRENTGGFASLVGGYQNNVPGSASFAAGRTNTVIGDGSGSVGLTNEVLGAAAFTAGSENLVSGDAGFSSGHGNKSQGYASLTGGRVTEANGYASTALGKYTKARGAYQTVIGVGNIVDPKTGISDIQSDYTTEAKGTYVFIIGNGTKDLPSNALTVDWNGVLRTAGDIYANGEKLAKQSTLDIKPGTKITDGGEIFNSSDNIATGKFSQSIGQTNEATGYTATASGRGTKSSGYSSSSNGYYTEAYGTAQFVIGAYNTVNNTKDDGTLVVSPHLGWTNPVTDSTPNPMNNKAKYLFIVGNGNKDGATINRSNAHTLDWSGNAWFAGTGTFHTDVNIIESDGTNHSILDDIKKINGDKNTDGSIAKAVEDMKNSILGDGIKDTYDTLKEIQNWIEGDGVNATELSTAISSKPGVKIPNGGEIFGSYSSDNFKNIASGAYSHAQGCGNTSTGPASHTQGHGNKAGGYSASAINRVTEARGHGSFAAGQGTFASGANQFVIGTYNEIDTENMTIVDGLPVNQVDPSGTNGRKKSKYAFILGNGNSTSDRKNAATLDWSGNAWFAGDVIATKYSPDGTESASISLCDVEYELWNEKSARKNGDDNTLSNAKQYTDEKFASVEIPEIPDLTPYATTDYVNTQDSEILSQAKAYTDEVVSNIDLPVVDLTGLATEEFVENKTSELSSRIDNITIDGGHSGIKADNNGTVFNRFNCDNPNTANGANSATFGTNGEADVIPEFRGLSFSGYTVSIMYSMDNSVIWSDVNNYDIYNRLCRYMQNISEFRVVLKNAVGNERSFIAKSILNDADSVFISGVTIDELESEEINNNGSYYISKIIRPNGADGDSSFVTGLNNTAQGAATFIGGAFNEAPAGASSSLGHGNLARGYASHASGRVTEARGHSSFTAGRGTFASGAQQFVFGTYNVVDTENLELDTEGLPAYQYLGGIDNYVENKSKFVHIVGNGTSDIDRKNAYALDWSGNAYFAGDVFVGCGADSTGGKRIPIVHSGTTPPSDDLGKDGDIYIMY